MNVSARMPGFDEKPFPPAFRETLTEEDLQKNSTLQSFNRIEGQLKTLTEHRSEIDVILDIGCGRGGFAAALANHLNASEVYGIDTDSSERERAEERGVATYNVDIQTEELPFEDGSIDLIVSFGLLEHLPYYTNFFEETVRVLDSGWFWVASPNLASWINRIALLFGYQPRNVEISQNRAVGSLPVYDRDRFLNHVSAPTYRALLDLLKYHGFDPIQSVPLSPYQRSMLDRTLDRIFCLRVGLARRVAILSRR